MVIVSDKMGPSTGPDSMNISDEHLRNVLEWLSEQDTKCVMPYEEGETNMHDSTEMHGFKISTEYHSDCVEIGFRTDEGLIVTTRKEIENLLS